MRIHMLALVALVAITPVFAAPKAFVPVAQTVAYLGAPASCAPSLPPPSLDSELLVFLNCVAAASPEFLKQETPQLLRMSYLLSMASWNSIVAFHPTAKGYAYKEGLGFPVPRFPNSTTAQKNTALAYTLLRMFEELSPAGAKNVAGVMQLLKLDPTYTGTANNTNPADIGNLAALATLAYGATDGFNADGMMGSSGRFTSNFSDYTNFKGGPNTAYELKDISKWQPLLETNGLGYFTVQQHLTPQAGRAKTFAITKKELATKYVSKAPYPAGVKPSNWDQATQAAYKAQADEVLAISAALNDTQKGVAELFDQKVFAFGFQAAFNYALPRKWDLITFLGYDFNTAAIYDSLIVSWKEKVRHIAVRPMSAIRHLYANQSITAWAGAYQGTKTFPGREFTSYLRTMPHSDWPSGTACVCVAFAEFTELFLGTPGDIGYSYTFRKGCSIREPGVTPANDTTITWTKTERFIQECAMSRVWAGVHFKGSVQAAVETCRGVGVAAYNKYKSLLG